MKTDLYTKVVLTVIATTLIWMCVRDIISPPAVHAAQGQEVIITGVRIPLKDGSGQQVTDINGKPLSTWQVPVRVFDK